jgi:tRNA pseudouridine38-40 synthase
MPRYKLLIEYDGTPFVGWQSQDSGKSVQDVVERACHRLVQAAVTVYAAGRTDAGVHASGQVAHVDLPRDFSAETVRDALNFHMKPHRVAVVAAWQVSDDFHARFSAVGRAYLYRIFNRRVPPALERDRAWWVAKPLDEGAMAEAAAVLIGHHDFTTFRDTDCQAHSPMKTLDVLEVTRDGEHILVRAAARSFLHHQVRNMVGGLKLVGDGRWRPEDMRRALEARDRRAGGPTAPAKGLCLTAVTY